MIEKSEQRGDLVSRWAVASHKEKICGGTYCIHLQVTVNTRVLPFTALKVSVYT